MSRHILSQYSFSLCSGEIQAPFYGPYGNDVIADFGLTVPCSVEEFHMRWSASSMAPYPEQRAWFLNTVSLSHLHKCSQEQKILCFRYLISDKKGLKKQVETQIRFVDNAGETVAEMTNYEVPEESGQVS